MSATGISRFAALSFFIAVIVPEALFAEPEKKVDGGHEVVAEELRIDLSWAATLLPLAAQEIGIDAAAWKIWLCEEAAAHGSRVKKGDVLLRVRDDELDRAILQLERDLRKAELALATAKRSAAVTEDRSKEALAAWKLAKDRAAETLADFRAIDKELEREGAELRVASAKSRLAYEKDELAELKKMYEADDLNDSTEEIVLQRQRDAVRAYDFAARQAARSFRNYDREQDRRREKLVLEAAVAARDYQLTLDLESMRREERQMALAAHETAVTDLKKQLAAHQSDREQLLQRADRDGIVYRGAFVDGKYVPSGNKAFVHHAKLPLGKPLLTIVGDGALKAEGAVKEQEVGYLSVGMKVALELPAAPGKQVVGEIATVAGVPVAPGSYPVTVSLPPTLPAAAVAGAGATVFCTPVYKKQALSLPTKLVHRDPQAPGKRVVWVKTGDKVEERQVDTGFVVGDKVEISRGLAAGEVVLAGPDKK